MAYCPTCKQQFTEGLTECPDDKTPLVDELPYQTIDGPSTAWVEIASVGTEEESNLLQGFLEAQGIPCQIESLKFTMEPVNFGSMGEIRVYVAAENEVAALDLLSQREDDYDDLPGDETVVTEDGPATITDDAVTTPEPEES